MLNNTNALIEKYEDWTGYENAATEEYQGAASFYLLADGRFLNCEADCGSRGDDHRIIFGAVEIEENDWNKLHEEYEIVRLIPECEMALVVEGQELTEEQRDAINEIGFEIEVY